MAFTPSVNNRPLTGSSAMFMVLTNFIAAGWTVQMSSDGTTYKSTPGSQITQGGSGANGMANTKAWFRIQDPGGVREFVVQRNTGNTLWAIKYSPSAKFTGGSPAATQAPTATDEVKIIGDITGATQTYVTFLGTDAQYSIHMMMGDASVGYGFWICALQIGTNSSSTADGWMMDVVTNPDASDLDPSVHFASSSVATHFFNLLESGNNAFGFFTSITSAHFLGLALQPWIISGVYGVGLGGGNAIGQNHWNNLEDMLPMMWGNTANGYKGWSTLFKTHISNSHAFGDGASVGNPPVFGTKDHLCVQSVSGSAGGLVVDWPAGVDCIN